MVAQKFNWFINKQFFSLLPLLMCFACGGKNLSQRVGPGPFSAMVIKRSEINAEGRLTFTIEPATFSYMDSLDDLSGPYLKNAKRRKL